MGLQQPRRDRGTPTGRQHLQPCRRGVHRRCRRQHHLGVLAPEGDQPDLVPPLIRVQQQREDRTLHSTHPLPGSHRSGRIHHEENEVSLPSLPGRLPQIVPPDHQSPPRPPPRPLMRGSGLHGRGQVQFGQGALRAPRTRRTPVLGTRPGPPPRRALAQTRHAQHLRTERLAGAYGLLLAAPGRLLPLPLPLLGNGLRGRVARLALGLRRCVGPVALRGPAAATGAVRVRIVVLAAVLLQRVVEFVLVQARRVEGIAPTPVGEREQSGLSHILGEHIRTPRPRGQRGGRPRHHDVRAHPVDLEGRAGGRDLPQRPVPEPHFGKQCTRGNDPGPQRAFLVGPLGGEARRIVVVRETPPHDLDPLIGLAGCGDLDGQPEPVEQLRPQFALFGVHRPDEKEARGMPHGDAFALHVRSTHGGRVQQQVHEVVVEQIDLVDVQNPAMGVGEQPRFKGLHALGERPLDVERPDEPVLGRTDRKLHHSRIPRHAGPGLMGAIGTRRIGRRRVAREPAPGDDGNLRHERGERTHGGGLGGALLAAHQHAADGGRDGIEQQPEPEIVLPDDGGERVRRTHDASLGERCDVSPSGVRGAGVRERIPRSAGVRTPLTRPPPDRPRAPDTWPAAAPASPRPAPPTAPARPPPAAAPKSRAAPRGWTSS